MTGRVLFAMSLALTFVTIAGARIEYYCFWYGPILLCEGRLEAPK